MKISLKQVLKITLAILLHPCSADLCWVNTGIFVFSPISWWRQMEIIFTLLGLCAGKSPVTGEVPSQRPVTRCFGVFFDLRLNQWLSKHSRRRWFKTPSRSFWRHCHDTTMVQVVEWFCIEETDPTQSKPWVLMFLERLEKRYPLKFHTKYLIHILIDMSFIQMWEFNNS